jgi:fructose-bisphosphate aldolase class 1
MYPRIANELTSTLNSLENIISTNHSKSSSTTNTVTSNLKDDIKSKVEMINGLLAEAVSSRLTKEQLNNSTTHAPVLANLANEVYFSYGRALGESPSSMSNMAGIAMSVKEAFLLLQPHS